MSADALKRPTLVLNRNWQPVRVATAGKALTLLYGGQARAIDPADYQTYDWDDWTDIAPDDGEPFVPTVSMRVRVPEVITLTRYAGTRHNVVTFNRRNVFRRDHYRCQYCGARPRTEELTIDHVTPRAQGGTSSWENCVLACLKCNNRKGPRTPDQAHMRLARAPRRPSWSALYAHGAHRIESWARFVSEKYWNAPLEE